MRDILRAAIAAERLKLLQTLRDESGGQRPELVDDIAACDSLLGRLGPARVVLYRIRGEVLRTGPLVKCRAGPDTDPFARAGARALDRRLCRRL